MNDEIPHSSPKLPAGFLPRFLIIFLLIFIGVTPGAMADLDGQMVGEVWLSPAEPDDFFGPQSTTTWRVDYTDGKVADLPGRIRKILYWPNTRLVDTGFAASGSMESGLVDNDLFGLTLDGYIASEFGPDYPIGAMGGSTRIKMGRSDLEYWINKGIVNYGGFSYSGIFLLEKGEMNTDYGSGLELSLSGTKISGLAVELTARVGMYPDPVELIGEKEGSGYDVFDPLGKKITGYTGSEVILKGIQLGSARFDSTTTFSLSRGFESTSISFTMEEGSRLLKIDGTFTYRPREKTISLNPGLDLDFACFDVYSQLSPSRLTNTSGTINGLSIQGYGIEKMQLGDVKISLLHALGNSKVYRPAGSDDYELRASDYTFPAPDEEAFYRETDYSGVLSITGGAGNLYLASDFYWDDSPGIFGLADVTGMTEYKLSEYFELSTGLVISLSGGVQNIIVKTIYRW